MRSLSLVVVLAACGGESPAPQPPQPPIPPRTDATTVEGTVTGQLDAHGIASFLGIPYAAPPVANARWREPSPPPKHAAPLAAQAFHLPCSQIPIPEGSDSFGAGKRIPSSEDCLYINVWVPPHARDAKLPVMLWLHGGQYLRGAASQYDGAHIAELGGVIVATIDYRLGPLGFLAHPALTVESPLHTSGNEALFDTLASLVWLRANAAAFDGDPQRITLFGESAGSASTCALMASPLAQNLFQRAILESDACPGADDTPDLASREAFGRRLGDALGCKSDDLAAELACMRSKTDDQVMTAIPLAKVLGDDGNGVGYRFNKDNVFLRESPESALKAGRVARIPVMLGTTDNEMGRYVGSYNISTADQLRAQIAKEWPKQARTLVDRYPVDTDERVDEQLAALYSDWGMTCPTRRDARWFSALGIPTYLYRFTHAPEVMGGKAGAFHGSELVYLFPSVFSKKGLVYTDLDRALANIMVGAWSRFAATGDPNGTGGFPAWPRYTTATDQHYILDITPSVGTGLRRAECDAWDQVGD